MAKNFYTRCGIALPLGEPLAKVIIGGQLTWIALKEIGYVSTAAIRNWTSSSANILATIMKARCNNIMLKVDLIDPYRETFHSHGMSLRYERNGWTLRNPGD